jgi:hypothetical protein
LKDSQCFALAPEFILKCTIDLDDWYNYVLPFNLKYDHEINTTQVWKGEHASIISYHFLALHLLLRRSVFLSSLEAARFCCDCDFERVSEILFYSIKVVNIAKLSGARATTNCMSFMAKQFLFFTGLFICASLGICGDETQSNHLKESVHCLLVAIEVYRNGPDHKSTLQSCLHSPKMATDILRANPIKWKY